MARPTTLRAAAPGLLRVLRRFAPHVRRERALIAGGGAALLAEVLLRLAEPWPLKFVLDRVIVNTPGATGGWVARLDPTTLLLLCALGVIAAVGLRALASYLSTVAFALAGNRVLTRVRAEVYRHLQRLSLRYHASARTGDLITRVTGDVGRLQEVTVTAALPLVANVVTFVGMAAVMIWRSPSLALIAFAVFPVFAIAMARTSKRITRVSRTQRKVEGALASVASESLGAMKVVQSYSLEETLERQFASSNARSMRDGVKAKRLAAGLERRTDVLVAVSTGLVLFAGARLVLGGALTPGDLVVFLTYLKNAFKPLRDFAKYTGRIAKAAASGERILDVLEAAPEIVDRPDAREAPTFRGDVRFEGVTFGYAADRPVLHDLDLHARPGQRVALVGPSGAGKSSIVGLLPRLYDPDAGRVLIDGRDIREYTLDSLRSQIGVVLQDSVLFATTVRDNIAYGAPDVSDEEVVAAARAANADDFIRALPDSYDTVLGERGATLSGGQRQRIAIARAAVRRARIVVLVEPTTGLDRESQQEVEAALAELTRGRTTFVVAHDLRTVVDADLICHVEDGRVVEVGRHDDLIARDGRYAALYAMQRLVDAIDDAPAEPMEVISGARTR
ncbi:MAG TPA: ABC transporter ATP-binding protein [Egibacteraceae bacterium]